MECHAFACPKRKIAQDVYDTLGKSSEASYELWQMDHADSKMYHTEDTADRLQFIFNDFPDNSYGNFSERLVLNEKNLRVN